MKRNYLTDALTVAALVSSLPVVRAQQQNSDLSNPTALTFDSSGNLLVASYPNTIIKFSSDGTKSTFATGVLGSSGLAFDNAGNLFVLDGDSHSIVKFTADGTKSIFATGIRNPQGLGCDRAGNLFVSEVGTESILRFTPNGTKSTFATGIRVPGTWHSTVPAICSFTTH
jgi:glucose/arabinose dehydrogenase